MQVIERPGSWVSFTQQPAKPLTPKDRKYHEGLSFRRFPSCTFVTFVVNAFAG
jgi:hypothetical protein